MEGNLGGSKFGNSSCRVVVYDREGRTGGRGKRTKAYQWWLRSHPRKNMEYWQGLRMGTIVSHDPSTLRDY
jgi:hypothetical protein